MKWFAVTAVSVLVAACLGGPARADEKDDAMKSATEAANTHRGKYGSAEGFNKEAAAGAMDCGKTAAFLKISVTGIAGTGDLLGVRIEEDSDFDGKPDLWYSAGGPISGVCRNGLISCSPGTWENCRPQKWAVAASLRVSLLDARLEELGDCFCLNASCGPGIAQTRMKEILSALGEGVSQAVSARDPGVAI